MEIVKKFLKNKYTYIIMFFIYHIYIDLSNRMFALKNISKGKLFNIENIIFSLFWIFVFIIIICLLKGILKKIFIITIDSILLIFTIINYFISNYNKTLFSWKDLLLSNEGLSFADSIYKFIDFSFVYMVLLALGFIVYMAVCSDVINNTKKISKYIFMFLFLIIIYFYINYSILLSKEKGGWLTKDVVSDKANIYSNWLDPNEVILIGGTYDYLFKDLYFSFLKKDNIFKSKDKVEKYIKNKSKETKTTNYKGLFENKNLIFVMMESMDDWMINEQVTPTIWEMMHHGFNFKEHYSPVYITGATGNTEFVANTGIYPRIYRMPPSYAYAENSYKYSIADLFQQKGYIVNSFHRSEAYTYNREIMHNSLGYKKYYDYKKIGILIENVDLDSYLIINGYDKIVSDEKFMSFIITFSPHSPYNYSQMRCQKNLEDIKKLNLSLDEETICSYSAARETDNMFKLLLEKLKKDKLLEDTVIVGFTDHPNNIVNLNKENSKLNKTSFFIYNSEMESNQINSFSSTINILPTLHNLFNLNGDYVYPGCDLFNCKENYVLFSDFTYYNGKEILPIESKHKADIDYSTNLLISDYYKDN